MLAALKERLTLKQAASSKLEEKRKLLSAPVEIPLPVRILELQAELAKEIPEHVFVSFFRPMLLEACNIAWGFPATDGNHHPGRFGLVEHSFGTALRMARQMKEVASRSGDKLLAEKQVLYAALAGLCHDLGKVDAWLVETHGYNYSPLTDTLRNTRFMPYCKVSGKTRHPNQSILYFARVMAVCPEFLYHSHRDVEIESQVIDAIIGHHDPAPAENLIWRQLIEADRADSAEFCDAQAIPDLIEIENRAEESMADADELKRRKIQAAILAIRTTTEKAGHNYGWYATANGWLMFVSPKWTSGDESSIWAEYRRLTETNSATIELWSLLKEAGIMVQLPDRLAVDSSPCDFPHIVFARNRSLTVAVFRTDKIFPEGLQVEAIDLKNCGRFEIDGTPVAKALEPQKVVAEEESDAPVPEALFSNEAINIFYVDCVVGKTKDQATAAAAKALLAILDKDGDVSSVLRVAGDPNNSYQPSIDRIGLVEHTLAVARESTKSVGIETSVYDERLLVGLAHDIGKIQRMINHVVYGKRLCEERGIDVPVQAFLTHPKDHVLSDWFTEAHKRVREYETSGDELISVRQWVKKLR